MPFHFCCSTSHMQTDISHCTNTGNELFLASAGYLPPDTVSALFVWVTLWEGFS